MSPLRDELRAALVLHYTPGLGPKRSRELIENLGSAKAVLEAPQLKEVLFNTSVQGLWANVHSSLLSERADKELDFLESEEIQCFYLFDEHYPEALRLCSDAPLLLFGRGAMDFQQHRFISIVGTRRCTNYGRGFVRELLSEIAPYHPTVVSGFAYGIDIVAQDEANCLGLQTIACLGHGLKELYPPEHGPYAERFRQHGGLLTEFCSDQPFHKNNFLRRNRIIAGLSQATLVIESAIRGGSLATARMANSYQREVFALPGRYKDRMSKGCNQLIARGQATALTSAGQLVSELGWDQLPLEQAIRKEPVLMSEDEKLLWKLLEEHGRLSRDSITIELGWDNSRLAVNLLEMEMRGLVKPLPGDRYERAW